MLQYIKKHKIIFFIALIVLIGIGYYGYNKFKGSNVQTSYVTALVEKGTLIVSVSSSGQISASNQVDIKSKVSGDISKVTVVSGQEVKAGESIAQIDAANAYKAVRDAQTGLETAQLSMDKLRTVDANSIFQSQNSVASAQTSLDKLKLSQPVDYQNALDGLQSANNNLDKVYGDVFTTISNIFLNLPDIITSLNDILYSDEISVAGSSIGSGPVNTAALLNYTNGVDQLKIKTYQIDSEADYAIARKAYDVNYQNFKNASLYSNQATVEDLLAETLVTAKAIAQAVKSENNYLNAWSDSFSLYNTSIVLRTTSALAQVNTYLSGLSTYSGQVNSSLSSLSSAQASIQSNKEAVTTAGNNIKTLAQNQPLDLVAAENSLKEKQLSLAGLMAGADPLDIRSQELSLKQKRDALYDAQKALADYTIKAPFAGIIAAVNVKVGDAAGSSGLATIVTKQQIAEISLNEVDVAKIKIGNKTTLTFDAFDGLSITGQVAEIDAIGAVAQGVVTYNVKIIFDTQDSRVKSGMSVNATIITNAKTDVLMVPNTAVKTDNNGGNYVQTLDSSDQPQNINIQIGLANDTNTEIISGLNEGDKVITQTINASATAQPSGSTGGMGIPGIGGGGGGNAIRRAVGD